MWCSGLRHAGRRSRATAAVVAGAGLLAWAPGARAATTDVWTGQGSATAGYPTAGDWQNASNWTAGAFVNGDALVFGALSGCAAARSACYTAEATPIGPATALSAASLSIGDDLPYELLAQKYVTLTLEPPTGTDGIHAAATGAKLGAAAIVVPLQLGDSQHWSVSGNGKGSGALSVLSVSGAPNTLAVSLSGAAQLGFNGDLDTGGLTVTGGGASTPAENGLVQISEDAGESPIAVDDAAAQFGAYWGETVQTGALVLADDTITVGAGGPRGPGVTNVSGTVAIDSASTTTFQLEGTGTTAGSDYGQLTASGNVTLGGQLALDDVGATSTACPTATRGAADTLISTTGALSGQFANLPDGAITSITARCHGATRRYPIQIDYTPTAVTGTFLAPTPTRTALTASPRKAVTGGNVTLTATVSPRGRGAGRPTGTVEFRDGRRPIRCSSGGVLSGTGRDIATCVTSTLRTGVHRLSAVYRGDGAWAGSRTAQLALTVARPPSVGFPRLGRTRVSHGTVRVTVGCARGSAACRVRLQLITTVTIHRRRRSYPHTLVLAHRRLTVGAGRRRVVTLRPGQTGRRLVHHRPVRAALVLRHAVGGHVSTVAFRWVTLRAPSRDLDLRH